LEETMSRAELERFVADVKADPRLQADLKERGSGVASIVEIARSGGYEITTQEVRDYVRSQHRDLTEEELSRVTAGGAIQMGSQVFGFRSR
jgi:predicted ribosomally synthesized peptide with nif11-like leader